ncbi:hypothetical protein Bbelb_398420 [Branchiostoma belcheri]|nr:hypothetical protein Bbelb_398420 [Branchiostoma belcheri]
MTKGNPVERYGRGWLVGVGIVLAETRLRVFLQWRAEALAGVSSSARLGMAAANTSYTGRVGGLGTGWSGNPDCVGPQRHCPEPDRAGRVKARGKSQKRPLSGQRRGYVTGKRFGKIKKEIQLTWARLVDGWTGSDNGLSAIQARLFVPRLAHSPAVCHNHGIVGPNRMRRDEQLNGTHVTQTLTRAENGRKIETG